MQKITITQGERVQTLPGPWSSKNFGAGLFGVTNRFFDGKFTENFDQYGKGLHTFNYVRRLVNWVRMKFC